MKKFRKFLCYVFGHRSICLLNYTVDPTLGGKSGVTGWKCERCDHTYTEQWDE